MTDLEKYLSEVEARAKAATPGPWNILWKGSGPYIGNWDIEQKMASCDYYDTINICRVDQYNLPIEEKHVAEENAQFIAHSRTDIPRLVEMVRKAQKALEPLLAWAEKNHQMPGYSEVIANAREALAKEKVVRGE